MCNFMVLTLCVLCTFTTIQCSGQDVTSSTLCSFKKLNGMCTCSYKSDRKNILILTADCARLNFEEFPRDTQLSNVQDLDLSHNAIVSLDSNKNNFESKHILAIKLSFNRINYVSQDFFQNTPNLIELDLRHNEITIIPNSNVFRGLGKLTILNMGYNKIPTLPEGVFSSLPQLQHLDLRYNYLGALFMSYERLANSSIGLTPNITILNLDGLAIKELPYMYFDGIENLKFLSLSNNPMEKIPSFPYSLDHLDLSGTRISTLSPRNLNYHSLKVLKLNGLRNLEKIEHYAFYNLQALEELHMSDCRNLKEFTDLAFGVIDNHTEWSLKKISLARSGLKTLNSTYLGLFAKLHHVDLQNNPWVCDCNMLWLQKLNHSLYNSYNLRCFSPPELLNKQIMVLENKNIAGCIESEDIYHRIVMSVLITLVIILIALIVYLIYLGPFYYKNSYRGIGPESPYKNTIEIDLVEVNI